MYVFNITFNNEKKKNPVYVRCGQSARDDINDVIHTQFLYIIDRSVIIVIIIIIVIVIIK